MILDTVINLSRKDNSMGSTDCYYFARIDTSPISAIEHIRHVAQVCNFPLFDGYVAIGKVAGHLVPNEYSYLFLEDDTLQGIYSSAVMVRDDHTPSYLHNSPFNVDKNVFAGLIPLKGGRKDEVWESMERAKRVR